METIPIFDLLGREKAYLIKISKTTYATNTYGAWYVNFLPGSVGSDVKYGNNYVRAVRGGQSGSLGNLVISPLSRTVTKDAGSTTFSVSKPAPAPSPGGPQSQRAPTGCRSLPELVERIPVPSPAHTPPIPVRHRAPARFR
jgi:hypothetical protein